MFELYGVGAVALCIALVEVAKKVGSPSRFSPILALIIGVVLGVCAYGMTAQGVVLGLAAGASAVGVYSGTKNVVLKEEE
ncbi:hypothetical protein DCC39_10290 [Pueribacillus theae]|uniref:Holin n=1 Tax=Pueribacillus theae TaxID=2171751 RepID=A0A2U1K285_9BACI|nr:hypothetical protein [Pueribacillus theae]PWA11078.1 hypothetical protein DCC39_10290 [Pueribacillus theae]